MQRGNSFTFLRLVFALTVVFAHAFPLGGFGDDPLHWFSKGHADFGEVAVLCFFVVSGFLITGSALRQSSIFQFALNRVARIVPGFWAMQLLTVFALTPAIMLARYSDKIGYWDSIAVGPNSATDYLLLNATFHIRQYPITNLFLHNPGGSAVNGSLWSLAPEVACYFYLGLLAVVGALRWKITGPVLFAVVYTAHLVALQNNEFALSMSHFLEKGWIFGSHVPLFRSVFVAFLTGLMCFQFRDLLRWRGWLAATAAVILTGGTWLGGFDFVWPFTLPYLVLYFAHRLPFERVEQWGDYSYGIYIYAFPIQQCLVLGGLHHLGFLPYFGVSVLLAVLAGMASWFALERPVLNWTHTLSKRFRPAKRPTEVASQLELLTEKS